MTKQSEAATSLSSGISGSAAVRVLPAACQPSGPAAGCCERTASEWPDRGRRAWALLNPSTFPIEHVKLRRLLRGVSSFKKAYQIYLVCQCCSANATTRHLLGPELSVNRDYHVTICIKLFASSKCQKVAFSTNFE